MTDAKISLAEYLREEAAKQEAACSQHPETAQLHAYSSGTLSGHGRDQITEHLSFCRQCVKLVLAMQQPSTQQSEASQTGSPFSHSGNTAQRKKRWWPWLACAACLLTGLTIGHLFPRLPPANSGIPLHVNLNSMPRHAAIPVLYLGNEDLVLVLPNLPPATSTAYSLTLKRNGHPFYQLTSLSQDEGGSLHIAIKAAKLSPGRYFCQLSGGSQNLARRQFEFEIKKKQP